MLGFLRMINGNRKGILLDRLNYCVVLNKGCLNYCVGKSYKYPDKYKMSGYFFVSERINLFVVCSSLFTISF